MTGIGRDRFSQRGRPAPSCSSSREQVTRAWPFQNLKLPLVIGLACAVCASHGCAASWPSRKTSNVELVTVDAPTTPVTGRAEHATSRSGRAKSPTRKKEPSPEPGGKVDLASFDGEFEPDQLPVPLAQRIGEFDLPPMSDTPEGDRTPGAEWLDPAGLTLNQAIMATLTADPVLRAGYEEICQAQADYWTSTLKPNPELEIMQTLLPLGRRWEADVREGGPPQFDVMIAQPIDWYLFGTRTAAMMSASRNVYATQAEFADLTRIRVMETAVASVTVLEAQALRDLAQLDVENMSRVEELTLIAVQNDARPQVELSRVRLDLLASRQELRDAETGLVEAQAELWARMGRMGDPRQLRMAEDLAAPLAPQELSLEEAVLLAEANRPDILALRWRVAQAGAGMEVEYREAYPEVVPMLGYTRQFQRRAIGFPDAHSWGIGVSIGLPIHDRNQGNRARAASEHVQSHHELQAGLVELAAEIAQLRMQLEIARQNAISTADEQLRLAEEVRDSINLAYEAGARPLIDVLDAQRNFRETYRNYITSRADYWRALYQFDAALGAQTPRE